jgi:hypothetical protein
MTQATEPDTDPGTLSAYPPDLSDLMPEALTIVEREGNVPSRNRLMREFKIGAPKATALREQLIAGHPGVPMSPMVQYELTGTTTYPQAADFGHPATPTAAEPPVKAPRPIRSWPVLLLALPAFVAVWSGWVGLGELTGFGVIHPLPGIADNVHLNTAITLPIGVETYAAYAIRVWLSPRVSDRARRFAKRSTITALMLGAGGQIAYHLLAASHVTTAPWEITTLVSALPVGVVFAGSALAHLVHTDRTSA